MHERGADGAGTTVRVGAILAAVAIMVAVIVLVGRSLAEAREATPYPPPPRNGQPAIAPAAEVDVFRLQPRDLAIEPDAPRRREAHRRTFAIFRALRAYPGAPPRVPHALTADEYRTPNCNACHERGGYVLRFASYAPVTPHPELSECLQCHLPDDALVGMPLPGRGPDAVCLQCHTTDLAAPQFVASDWRTTLWPVIDQRAMPGSPPFIPHRLELRGNCLACHMAPGGVEEIRTTHPERANCRQCHVPAPIEEDVFVRPLDAALLGGAP